MQRFVLYYPLSIESLFKMQHMKYVFSFFIALYCLAPAQSQPPEYTVHVSLAESLYTKGAYAASANEYSAAFKTMGWKGYSADRYNAARSWSMAGVPDSAFFNLFKIAEKLKFDNLDALTTEPAFKPLHALSDWERLCTVVKSNQPEHPELAKELKSIYVEDQKYRQMIDSVMQQHGRESAEIKALWSKIQLVDSINTARVSEILDTYGWLGPKAVGETGNSALFLVVQHADIAVQEKYLPMMREAVKSGNAQGSSLALLEDRVLMRHGKKQIYGSQVRSDPATGEKYFFPIEDVDRVDERRAAVGLGPLAEYARHFGIVWDEAAKERNKGMVPGKE